MREDDGTEEEDNNEELTEDEEELEPVREDEDSQDALNASVHDMSINEEVRAPFISIPTIYSRKLRKRPHEKVEKANEDEHQSQALELQRDLKLVHRQMIRLIPTTMKKHPKSQSQTQFCKRQWQQFRMLDESNSRSAWMKRSCNNEIRFAKIKIFYS